MRWNESSAGSVKFDYWQGTDPNTYIPNSDYNGLSSIYFASSVNGPSGVSPNVLGLTQVWYDTQNGEILEADTVLNDQDFIFTTNPTNTSGPGSGGATYINGRAAVFLENVVTHELGHSFGLSHSGALQATMLFMESPEQAHLGCDDTTAIRALYPSSGVSTQSTISGSVVTPSYAPVFGAQVVAISRRRGTVLATALTDRSGHYTLSALEAGTYFILVEPYFPGSQTLSAYYAGSTSYVCPKGQSFGRTFLMDFSGRFPAGVEVAAGATSQAPTLVAQCGGSGSTLPQLGGSTQLAGAPEMMGPDTKGLGFGAVDWSFERTTQYYKLSEVSGHLEIHALSYGMYSPIRSQLSLLDASGRAVGSQISNPVYSSESGFKDFDTSLIAEVSPGNYYVAVTSSYLVSDFYPAGSLGMDSTPFVLLTGSINEGAAPSAPILPMNSHCRMPENFSAYASPPGEPPRTDIQGGFGFCGTVRSQVRSDRQGNTPISEVVGWFLPLGLAWVIPHIAKRRRTRSYLAHEA